MAVLEFGEWLPDVAPLGNPGVVEATNVRPASRGYEPMPDLAVITSALTNRARGAVQGISESGDVHHYAGDSGKLYENVDETWTDRSITGGYSTASGEIWEFTQWKDKMLATNFTDSPQQITFGGTNFSNLTTALEGRHIAVVRDFVVLGSTNDASDGEVPHRVRWSAIDDETDWTVSASTLSDFQDLKVDSVQRVIGGEYGVILQRKNVWRMTFVGSPTVFQFDNVLPGIGAMSPGAVIRFGNFIYFLSERGFYRVRNGTTAEPIGTGRVDKHVLDDIDTTNLNRMSAAADASRVYWAYPGEENSGGTPNRIVVYDTFLDKWSILNKELELIWSSSSTGTTLDGLDSISASIDDLSASLDSQTWKGGQTEVFSGFDTDNKSGFFDSSTNLTATIKTAERELTPGRQTNLQSFKHVIDGGTVTAKVGTRQSQSDPVTFSVPLNERSTSRFVKRSNSRYHQFEFEITGNWNYAIGMQIDSDDIKRGGRRGR